MAPGGGGAASHRYWRINVTDWINAGYLIIGEAELRDAGGTDQVPTMTAATTSGVTVSASNSFGFGFEGWNGFDGSTANSSNQWTVGTPASPEWVKVDFGAGNEKAVASYAIAPRDSDGATYAPKTFTLDWSDDNSNWTTVNTQTGLTSGWTAGTLRVFTV